MILGGEQACSFHGAAVREKGYRLLYIFTEHVSPNAIFTSICLKRVHSKSHVLSFPPMCIRLSYVCLDVGVDCLTFLCVCLCLCVLRAEALEQLLP